MIKKLLCIMGLKNVLVRYEKYETLSIYEYVSFEN